MSNLKALIDPILSCFLLSPNPIGEEFGMQFLLNKLQLLYATEHCNNFIFCIFAVGRITIALRKNFRCLCTGKRGISISGKRHQKSWGIFMAQVYVVSNSGTASERIYGQSLTIKSRQRFVFPPFYSSYFFHFNLYTYKLVKHIKTCK